MKCKYTIHVASPEDAAGIARVQVDTWQATYKQIIPDTYLEQMSYEKHEKMWVSILNKQQLHFHMWVVKNSVGEVIGFSTGEKNTDNSLPFDGEIHAIYLLKEYQGQGIGKNLFLNSFEQLFRHGYSNAMVWVLEDNPTTGFYQTMGGKPVGEKWEVIGGKKLKEIAYGWTNILATLQMFRPQIRHPNIRHYSDLQEDDCESVPLTMDEQMSIGSPLGKAMGLKRLGIHHELLPPGRRTSWPHAELDEEEFIYVIEGHPHVWIDGEMYQLNPGDSIAFPCGTGVCHTVINNSTSDVRLLVVGESSKNTNKFFYPLHPASKELLKEHWWDGAPQRSLGAHDGLPNRFHEKDIPCSPQTLA